MTWPTCGRLRQTQYACIRGKWAVDRETISGLRGLRSDKFPAQLRRGEHTQKLPIGRALKARTPPSGRARRRRNKRVQSRAMQMSGRQRPRRRCRGGDHDGSDRCEQLNVSLLFSAHGRASLKSPAAGRKSPAASTPLTSLCTLCSPYIWTCRCGSDRNPSTRFRVLDLRRESPARE